MGLYMHPLATSEDKSFHIPGTTKEWYPKDFRFEYNHTAIPINELGLPIYQRDHQPIMYEAEARWWADTFSRLFTKEDAMVWVSVNQNRGFEPETRIDHVEESGWTDGCKDLYRASASEYDGSWQVSFSSHGYVHFISDSMSIERRHFSITTKCIWIGNKLMYNSYTAMPNMSSDKYEMWRRAANRQSMRSSIRLTIDQDDEAQRLAVDEFHKAQESSKIKS